MVLEFRGAGLKASAVIVIRPAQARRKIERVEGMIAIKRYNGIR
jgi:hypothetical protein